VNLKLVVDGNFLAWFRFLLIVVGIAMAVAAVKCNLPIIIARIVLLSGFAIALIGGMTSRAAMLRIKPFDNSYRKARKSYVAEGDKPE
jgi:hypothetical protein